MNYKEQLFKLKDVANITMGQSPKSEFYNESMIGTPFLQGNTTFGDKYPGIEKYTTKETRISNKNEVLMSVRAPVGDININPYDRICIGRGLCSISLKNNENEYLYYFLKSKQKFIQSRGTGTVFASINKSDIENIDIFIPTEIDIERMVAPLRYMDNKIENNNAIISNLEEQAQAIFKSWFIDFEPFQDGNFVDSELGEIPEGWEVRKLGDFFPVVTGKKNANIAIDSGKIPFFTCSQNILYTDNFSFDANVILLAGNGDFNVKRYKGKFEAYQRTYVLIPKDDKLVSLLYYLIDYYLPYIISGYKGSVINYITKGMIEDFSFPFPKNIDKLGIIQAFNSIEKSIFNLKEQNETLAQLRDILLPKLMSGELRLAQDDIEDIESQI
ncbi:MAG: restriction endonuclease subunit S [Anaerococcus sp.]